MDPVPAGDKRCDVAVAGGGAAGLAAALAAARAGARVAVIERDVECGRKILATGNGRCNLTNERLDPARYRHPTFAAAVMGAASEQEIARFWDSLGLLTVSLDGWVYPRTKRAESVRDVLTAGCERAGVLLLRAHEVRGAAYDAAAGLWRVDAWAPVRLPSRRAGETDRRYRRRVDEAPQREARIAAPALIVATGGGAAAWSAWTGVRLAPESPVLCPLGCRDDDGALAALDGVRADAALALMRGDELVAREEGEVLFRRYGVSGICAFNLSRRCEPGDVLRVDLFPELAEAKLAALLARRLELLGAPEDARGLDGLVARPLADVVWARASAGAEVAQAVDGKDDFIARLAHTLKCLSFTVTGLAETASAQVTRGGLAVDAFSPSTLAARERPGLYAVGEALDMDADCGGFNLAWAWMTGLRAGGAAADYVRGGR